MNTYIKLGILLLTVLPNLLLAQSAQIAIDGEFSDWTKDLKMISEEKDVPAGVDLMALQASNDNEHLFIRIEANREFGLLDKRIYHKICLYIDTDNDENTGLKIQNGYGADLMIYFNAYYGIFYITPSVKIKLNDISMVSAPSLTSSQFEIAIDRKAKPDGINELFKSDTIKLLLINKDNNDRLPDEGEIFTYTFDRTSVPAYTPVDVEKNDNGLIRILNYNTENDGLKDINRVPAFENIIKAINPDIIGFTECYETTAEYVKQLLDAWLPVENPGWYVVKKDRSDLITAAKFPIKNQFIYLPQQFPVFIDLPDDYSDDLLFINSHLKCCDGDSIRQDEIDRFIAFILKVKKQENDFIIPYGTPFVYGGDLNLIGYSQQLHTLLNGDIINTEKYGKGGPPDWDSTEITSSTSMQADIRMNYTWINLKSRYIPAKMDYCIYSDASIKVDKSFALQTEKMSNVRLNRYGLHFDDTQTASDHFPLVTDFILSVIGSKEDIKENYVRISPNPATDYIDVMLSEAKESFHSVKIYDVLGNIVLTYPLAPSREGESVRLDVSGLAAGVYFVRVGGKVYKFVKL